MSGSFRPRFPEYDVLDKWDSPSWNEATRAAVGKRLDQVPQRRFLSESAWEVLECVCNRLVPQPDRRDKPVPIAPFIDNRLVENRGNGYRYEGLPPLREAWRKGIAAIDEEARARWDRGFCALPANQQDAVLRAVQHGDVLAANWQDLPPKLFFKSVLLLEVVSVYYAHPAAWSEIGFGGPASPRGYVRLGADRRDPWESVEADDQ